MDVFITRVSRLSWAMLLILAALLPLLSACTGGGGGATGARGISYAGVTTPASLTTANANIIFSAIWNGGSSSGSMGAINLAPTASKAAPTLSPKNAWTTSFVKRIGERVSSDVAGFSGASKKTKSMSPISDTYSGRVSGTRTTSGNMDFGSGTGSLAVTYTNFNDGDVNTYDGVITMRIDGYDAALDLVTDMNISFTSWTIKWADGNVSLNGSMGLKVTPENNTDQLTVNVDGRDNISNDTFRFENYVEATVYDDLLYPTTSSETYSGRVYLGAYGYVDVSTVSPCLYSDPQADPDSGGPIVLAGSGNARARILPVSSTYVRVEVDADGDSVFESKNAYPWNNLGGAPTSVCVANAGPDQAATTGALVTLDGSRSMDLSGGALTYAWTITAKPAGSSAVLSSPSLSTTTFTADMTGTYTITLLVGNGTTASSPDTVIVTAAMASAGFQAGLKYSNPTGMPLGDTALGDLNGDGLNDAAVLEMSGSRIQIYKQNASGVLSPSQLLTTTLRLSGIVLADVNNDGLADLIVSGITTTTSGWLGRIVVYKQDQTSHTLGNAQEYSLSTNNVGPLAVADLNNDSLPDIIAAGGIVSIMFQGAAGALSSEVTYTYVSAVINGEVHVADMNSDGLNDIVLQSGNKQLAVIRQLSPGTFSSTPDFYTVQTKYWPDFNSFALGDLNGDGRTDVAVADPTGYLNIFHQSADGMLTGPIILDMNQTDEVDIADMNGDGSNDIILLNGGSSVRIFYQAADHSFSNQSAYALPTSSYGGTLIHQALSVGDVTGNGQSDVVASWSNEGIFVLPR